LTSSPLRASFVHDQLPEARDHVVAQQVGGAFGPTHLEIAVVGREPLVEHICDLDAPLAEMKPARRLLAPMTRVTLDPDPYMRVGT